MSLAVKDNPEQTKAILRSLARHNEIKVPVQFNPWRAFQKSLEVDEHQVVALHSERIAHWSATNRGWSEARQLAYGELVDQWRKLHGRKWPSWQCAGCEMPIGDLSALTLSDYNRVHFGDRLDCLTCYGRRWRGEATAALCAIGIIPERDWEK